ncbi:hypothetical protein FHS42_000312 [Streptomyces zagrosensis]|uniref:Uncharacterized protein n=1 Tax=Streptomyces zagrosensis TaxID=1042984 RepID=A0A7W9Q4M8_9ACTN|nr:hypothetical protein [Streptomyces zagrosensis]
MLWRGANDGRYVDDGASAALRRPPARRGGRTPGSLGAKRWESRKVLAGAAGRRLWARSLDNRLLVFDGRRTMTFRDPTRAARRGRSR